MRWRWPTSTGDGIPDLIVANYNDDTVSVLLGKGDGTFLPQEVFPVGEKPYSLAVADLNGDGKPDIIVANSASDTVSVLLNLGGGKDYVNFAPQTTFATGRQPFSVAVADLTGDGIPDIVTANAFDNTVSVLLGNGDGTFQTQRTFAVGSRPYSVAVADLTGDGKPDIVTTNYGGNSVSVLLNNGGGSFAEPADLRHRQVAGPDRRGGRQRRRPARPRHGQQPRQRDRGAAGQG